MSDASEPYRIRLRGPWEVTLIERDGTAEPLRFAYLPAEWRELFGDRAGTAVFRRRFNRPTGLGPTDEVCIVLTSVPGEVEFQFNGRALPPCESTMDLRAFDITRDLEEHNLIEVRVADDPGSHAESPGGLWETVCLEIRAGRTEGSEDSEGVA